MGAGLSLGVPSFRNGKQLTRTERGGDGVALPGGGHVNRGDPRRGTVAVVLLWGVVLSRGDVAITTVPLRGDFGFRLVRGTLFYSILSFIHCITGAGSTRGLTDAGLLKATLGCWLLRRRCWSPTARIDLSMGKTLPRRRRLVRNLRV